MVYSLFQVSLIMKNYDVIIIGAGAAGMMCAIEAGKRGRSVLIVEKADKVGKKILISGGGRCNFTNMFTESDNFLSNNEHFCKSALSRYTQWDFIAMVESHSLSWTEKTLGQLFCDQKSKAIVQMLVDECKHVDVDIELNEEIIAIKHVAKNEDTNVNEYSIETPQTDYKCESLVIATGGPSIPKMGATDFALSVAEQFKLATIPFTAALVPFIFTVDVLEDFIKELSGISTFVELGVCKKEELSSRGSAETTLKRSDDGPQGKVSDSKSGKSHKSEEVSFKENILFTHRGISGPAALQISSYWELGDSININLFPDFDLFNWLKEQQKEHPQAELKTVLGYKLPKRFVAKICQLVISPEFERKTLLSFKDDQFEQLIQQLENWEIEPSGTEGMRTAEVALGGVDTNELSSKTFEAKTQKGLYFIGEAIDITGHLGGFNFQWAWASGWCAGQVI
ncbi:MAG: putative flavoprotein YhiN [Cocleimonas sp.]|jgi:predicted flavoprotein YhiN